MGQFSLKKKKKKGYFEKWEHGTTSVGWMRK